MVAVMVPTSSRATSVSPTSPSDYGPPPGRQGRPAAGTGGLGPLPRGPARPSCGRGRCGGRAWPAYGATPPAPHGPTPSVVDDVLDRAARRGGARHAVA